MENLQTKSSGAMNIKRLFCLAPLSLALLAPVATVQAGDSIKDNIEWFGSLRLRAEDLKYSDSGDADRARIRLRFGAKVKIDDTLSIKYRLRSNADNNNSSHDTLGADSSVDFGYDQAYATYTGIENLTLQAGKMPDNYFRTSELYLEDTQIPEGVSATYKMDNIKINAAHYFIEESKNGSDKDLSWDHLQLVYGGNNYTLGLGHIALGDDTSTNFGDFEASEITTLTAKMNMGKMFFNVDANVSNQDADSNYTSQGQALITRLGYHFNDKVRSSVIYYQKGQYSTLANGEFTETDMLTRENLQAIMLQANYKISPKVSVTPRYFYSETLDSSVSGADESQYRYQVTMDIKF